MYSYAECTSIPNVSLRLAQPPIRILAPLIAAHRRARIQQRPALDLQEDFGLQDIKACGIYDRFRKVEGECTEQTIICDKYGTVHLDHTGEGRPEIKRNALTQLLLSSIAEGSIRWNTKVLRVVPADGSQKNIVEFTDSSSKHSISETYDLIVGADGAWSRARTAIPSAPQAIYSNVCSVTIDIPSLRSKDP